jgi:predicted anti-sigma-YlaC factor YlaD
MMKKGDIPGGQKRAYTRPKPEKEEVMNTTKTLKAVAMICAGIILLQGYAAAADQYDQVARVDTGARYTTDTQNTGQAETKTAETMSLGTIMLAEVVAPWGLVPGLITVYSGIGTIVHAVDALIPGNTDKPENNREVERLAHENAENNKVVDLTAKDKD